jgi:cysteine desulfurase family protein
MNSPCIYLDNASTSFPKPPGVSEAMRDYLDRMAANPGRAAHHMAAEAEQQIVEVRAALSRMFDGPEPSHIAFCLNGTDALNMAIKGVLREGDHAITTMLEHNSVSRPLQAMADAGFITLTRVGASSDGYIDPAEVASAWTAKTRLVAVTHASNVLGTVQPVGDVGPMVRERGGLFLVDAAQTAGVIPISMRDTCIDLLAFPGHKGLLGPTGTGALLVGDRVDMRPWREGGTGGDSATPTQPTEFPHYLESGTPNTVGIAGLRAALAYVEERGIDNIHQQEEAMTNRLIRPLAEDGRFTLYGVSDGAPRVATLSVNLPDLSPTDAGAILDTSYNIAVRCGLHCAPYTHRAVGTFPDGTVRISPGVFTTEKDIDMAVEALISIVA